MVTHTKIQQLLHERAHPPGSAEKNQLDNKYFASTEYKQRIAWEIISSWLSLTLDIYIDYWSIIDYPPIIPKSQLSGSSLTLDQSLTIIKPYNLLDAWETLSSSTSLPLGPRIPPWRFPSSLAQERRQAWPQNWPQFGYKWDINYNYHIISSNISSYIHIHPLEIWMFHRFYMILTILTIKNHLPEALTTGALRFFACMLSRRYR